MFSIGTSAAPTEQRDGAGEDSSNNLRARLLAVSSAEPATATTLATATAPATSAVDIENPHESRTVRSSSSSSSTQSELECRICRDTESIGRLLSPCQCTGSVARVHAACLEKWIMTRPYSNDVLRCEICHSQYRIKLVHRLKCDLEHLLSCTAFSHCVEGSILLACLCLMCSILFFLTPSMGPPAQSERMLIVLFAITSLMSILALRKVYLRWHEASSVPVIL